MTKQPTKRNTVEAIFYGNFFYGVCVVLLAIESDLLQKQPLNGPLFYAALFAVTVLFYNYPYARLDRTGAQHPRGMWHQRNLAAMRIIQIVFTCFVCITLVYFYRSNQARFEMLSWRNGLIAVIFPLVGACYYGINVASVHYNLRSIGWLKPFLIGLVWAGVTIVLPQLYRDIITGDDYSPDPQTIVLFLKNFMYLSVLAIMFDIKDFTADSDANLRTLVVSLGLRKTIFYVLIPLSLLGAIAVMSYGLLFEFSAIRLTLLTFPLLLLLPAAWSLKKRRTLLYYLIVIDGLIFLKALFGILASYF